MKEVTIFTDGSCLGNPGPGGWGAILRYGEYEQELSGGFKYTTNNRMEIMAAIMSLERLKESCNVALYTDSQYVHNAVEKKWLQKWQKNNWKTAGEKAVKNRDLWERLHMQLMRHNVIFRWVRGHNGHIENERCDVLARKEASCGVLPDDIGFINEENLS